MRQKQMVEAKVVIVGDVGVGKSSLAVQYVHQKFDSKMESTLGAAYMQKIETFQTQQGTRQIKLKIWDTAGQQKYKAIAKLYYKDCQAAIVVYDATRRQSFENVKMWITQLNKHAPLNIYLAIAGNKIDLLDQSANRSIGKSTLYDPVFKIQGETFSKAIGASVFAAVSAKSQQNVSFIFTEIAKAIYLQSDQNVSQIKTKVVKKQKTIKIQRQKSKLKEKQKCCEN